VKINEMFCLISQLSFRSMIIEQKTVKNKINFTLYLSTIYRLHLIFPLVSQRSFYYISKDQNIEKNPPPKIFLSSSTSSEHH